MTAFCKTDITGKKFNRLTVLKFVPDSTKYSFWLCKCDCGSELTIQLTSITSGQVKSCGCLKKEVDKRSRSHGHAGTKTRTATYSSWAAMMDRCEWGGHKIMYSRYGAKGIRVWPGWFRFEDFLKDMGERPSGTSIDRIDNTKGYFPGNCRWATRAEQAMNRSTTVKVLHEGKVWKVKDLIQKLGLKHSAIRARAQRRQNDYALALKSVGVNCENVQVPA